MRNWDQHVRSRFGAVVGLLAAGLLSGAPVAAQEAAPREVAPQEAASQAAAPDAAAPQAAAPHVAPQATPDKWQFEITPYFFGAGLDGTVGVTGVTGDVDMGIGDILDRLDSAFMGMVEVRKKQWGILFDGIYMNLKAESTRSWQGPGGLGTATGQLSTDLTQKVYNLAYAKRVVDEGTRADLILGTRFTQLESHLNLVVTSGGLLPGGVRSVSDEQSWWDPIFGFRMILPFAEHWSSVLYADLGGFGVGSDLTSQGLVGINWDMTNHFVAKIGYRYIFADYSDDGFVWEMAAHGPYAGVGIRF
jgi:hypothetical protein